MQLHFAGSALHLKECALGILKYILHSKNLVYSFHQIHVTLVVRSECSVRECHRLCNSSQYNLNTDYYVLGFIY